MKWAAAVFVLGILAGAGLLAVGISRSISKADCYGNLTGDGTRSCDAMPDGDNLITPGVVAGVGSLLLLTIGLPIGGVVVRGRADANLRRNGREAAAEVLVVKDTGLTVNDDPQVRLTLRV